MVNHSIEWSTNDSVSMDFAPTPVNRLRAEFKSIQFPKFGWFKMYGIKTVFRQDQQSQLNIFCLKMTQYVLTKSAQNPLQINHKQNSALQKLRPYFCYETTTPLTSIHNSSLTLVTSYCLKFIFIRFIYKQEVYVFITPFSLLGIIRQRRPWIQGSTIQLT